jgi:hypothetical protein
VTVLPAGQIIGYSIASDPASGATLTSLDSPPPSPPSPSAVAGDPITLEELLRDDFNLVTYNVRYGGPAIGVMIAGQLPELAEMADAMTDSGDYCDHITNMLIGTPYFPWGEGDTFQEAVDRALQRVNTVPRDQWFKCVRNAVWKAPGEYGKVRDSYRNWEPLPPVEELLVEWGYCSDRSSDDR